MESVAYKSNTRKTTMQNIKLHKNMQDTLLTPKDRLHTVEEFIGKLEQAVLEKL